MENTHNTLRDRYLTTLRMINSNVENGNIEEIQFKGNNDIYLIDNDKDREITSFFKNTNNRKIVYPGFITCTGHIFITRWVHYMIVDRYHYDHVTPKELFEFNMAHELGHRVDCYSNLTLSEDSTTNVDEYIRRNLRWNVKSKDELRKEEIFADIFAIKLTNLPLESYIEIRTDNGMTKPEYPYDYDYEKVWVLANE